jgi:hypothetical protein
MNDGELESDESGDDDESESDDVYVFLTSSGNHDDTEEDFDEADDVDEAADGSVDDDDFESFLENMLNIELEADAGGFEFANDMFVCVCVCYY